MRPRAWGHTYDRAVRFHRSQRGAYIALAVLTLLWGTNWVAMKFALTDAHPVLFNIERTWSPSPRSSSRWWSCGGRSCRSRGPRSPSHGLFQTAVNMGSTTMAVASGGAGRAVRPGVHDAVLDGAPRLARAGRARPRPAVGGARPRARGLTLVVAPWHWQGDIASKGWAVLSGFGWAAGTVAMKYFQRAHASTCSISSRGRCCSGVLPLSLLPVFLSLPDTNWSGTYVGLLLWTGGAQLGSRVPAVDRHPALSDGGTASLNMLAIPVIALLSSMAVFGERLSESEWIGIGCIGIGLVVIRERLACEPPRRAGTARADPARGRLAPDEHGLPAPRTSPSSGSIAASRRSRLAPAPLALARRHRARRFSARAHGTRCSRIPSR
jgi:drug/metabolite transporter (DMT)-like permease